MASPGKKIIQPVMRQPSTSTHESGSENSENAPPIAPVEFEEDIACCEHYPQLRRFSSFRDKPRSHLLGYALMLLLGQLLLASFLHKAGVTETDLLEEFVAHSMLQNGWARINGSISMAYVAQEKLRPGYQLAQKGAKAKYPIVMVPGEYLLPVHVLCRRSILVFSS